jgi:hypothetical protein
MKQLIFRGLVGLLAALLMGRAAAGTTSPVTEISADMGPCSAEFRVTDMAGNGIFNANIHTVIRYGFMGKRKLELDAGTNSEGRARFIKLPAEAKKPIEFTVSHAGEKVTRSYDPATNCRAQFDIPLSGKRSNP